MGCDSPVPLYPLTSFPFQSTHPHGVRHHHLPILYTDYPFQSTHPHRGATFEHNLSQRFQSTHPHDATLLVQVANRTDSFNPRTRIGATLRKPSYRNTRTGFNPRTRMGCDSLTTALKVSFFSFQSTHPHGVRLI